MFLSRIGGENFRALERFTLDFIPGLNLITGDNAAGKTSLLEAIYILSRGRSFRGAGLDELLPPGAHQIHLSGCVDSEQSPKQTVDLVWDRAGVRVTDLTERSLTLADLARTLPVQIVDPGSHRLLEEGPGWRRRYLDWGLFHVEPAFFPIWRRYQRALRQRNQALKQGSSQSLVQVWDIELAEAGESVHDMRAAHLGRMTPSLGRFVRELLGTDDWQIELLRGWDAKQSLLDVLSSSYGRDLAQGQTQHGPHRAELKLQLHQSGARHRISRGQQKLLVCALVLAQALLVQKVTQRAPILLLDDFPAELGTEFRRRLAAVLKDCRGQCIVTSAEPAEALSLMPAAAVFHVERGRSERRA